MDVEMIKLNRNNRCMHFLCHYMQDFHFNTVIEIKSTALKNHSRLTRARFNLGIQFYFSSDADDNGKYNDDFGFDNFEDLKRSRFGKTFHNFSAI